MALGELGSPWIVASGWILAAGACVVCAGRARARADAQRTATSRPCATRPSSMEIGRGELRVSRPDRDHQLFASLRDRSAQSQQRVPATNCVLRFALGEHARRLHRHLAARAPRPLRLLAPVTFASEESFPPASPPRGSSRRTELYLSQLNLLRPNASGANASAALAARIRGRAVLVAMNELWPPSWRCPSRCARRCASPSWRGAPARSPSSSRRRGRSRCRPSSAACRKVALPACTAWHADGAALRAALAAGDNVTVSLPRYRRYSYADEPLPEHMITSLDVLNPPAMRALHPAGQATFNPREAVSVVGRVVAPRLAPSCLWHAHYVEWLNLQHDTNPLLDWQARSRRPQPHRTPAIPSSTSTSTSIPPPPLQTRCGACFAAPLVNAEDVVDAIAFVDSDGGGGDGGGLAVLHLLLRAGGAAAAGGRARSSSATAPTSRSPSSRCSRRTRCRSPRRSPRRPCCPTSRSSSRARSKAARTSASARRRSTKGRASSSLLRHTRCSTTPSSSSGRCPPAARRRRWCGRCGSAERRSTLRPSTRTGGWGCRSSKRRSTAAAPPTIASARRAATSIRRS